MFGSPSFIEPGQLRNPTALLQRQQLSMPVTNPSPRAAGMLLNRPVSPGMVAPGTAVPAAAPDTTALARRAAQAGVARLASPSTGVVPPSTPTVPNAGPAQLQGLQAMRRPMGFGAAMKQIPT
jgi:hypothetical protein